MTPKSLKISIAIISFLIVIISILNAIQESEIQSGQENVTTQLINSHYEMSRAIAMNQIVILEYFNQLGENKSYSQIRESNKIENWSSQATTFLKNANSSLVKHFDSKKELPRIRFKNHILKICLIILAVINAFLAILLAKKK
jgi:hypothetical protein